MNEYITLISTISAALVAAGSTILGVWLNNRSNERRLLATLQHEKDLKEKEFLRDKLEELHEVFTDYMYEVVKFTDLFKEISNKKNDVDKFIKSYEENYYNLIHGITKDCRRVELLVSLYFVDLKEEFCQIKNILEGIDDTIVTPFFKRLNLDEEFFINIENSIDILSNVCDLADKLDNRILQIVI